MSRVRAPSPAPDVDSEAYAPIGDEVTVGRTHAAPYPSGKGEVCKTFMQRFDSARRLQSFKFVRNAKEPPTSKWAALDINVLAGAAKARLSVDRSSRATRPNASCYLRLAVVAFLAASSRSLWRSSARFRVRRSAGARARGGAAPPGV